MAYPLIFGFRDVVAGRGFLAGVQVQGFALLEHEDGAWWMTGVQPSGIVDYGSTEAEAYAEFRATFRNVLFDSALMAADYEAFKADVELLFNQSTDSSLQRWLDARVLVRALTQEGRSPDGEYVAALPLVKRDDVKPRLRVARLDQVAPAAFTPQQNETDRLEAAA